MNTQFSKPVSLSGALRARGNSRARFQFGPGQRACLGELARTSVLDQPAHTLSGRSVLLLTVDAFTAAVALIELDGVARRIVLCPPDFSLDYLGYVVDTAGVDVILSDHAIDTDHAINGIDGRLGRPVDCFQTVAPTVAATLPAQKPAWETEWILLTSGTTGRPKLVVHTLATLCGAIPAADPASPIVWSTFYDIRRYGGLQILLRSILAGGALILPGPREPLAQFFARAAEAGVTHISGTPTHWRKALLHPEASWIEPRAVRLSGEIADQAILNQMCAFYPQAKVTHAFASTEAGVACEVSDGLAGLPEELFDGDGDPAMKVVDGSLRIRSSRTALRYLAPPELPLKDEAGFVDTGDLLELRNWRYCFTGRRDGMVNVGGLKVHPEEIEAVINRFPEVQMSLVRSKKSPITGALVVAEVVLRTDFERTAGEEAALPQEILLFCREWLPSYKVPALVRIVASLPTTASGKLSRRDA